MRNYDTKNRDRKQKETENKIMEVSVIHFGKSGYARTIMRNIAKDAGVAYGLISKYYETKEKLLLEAYKYALMKIYGNNHNPESVYEILMDLIDHTREMYGQYPDFFCFFKTIMNSSDLPERFIEERKNLFYTADCIHLYYEAQMQGALPSGDVFGLFQIFLVTLFNSLDMHYRYGLPEPQNQVFFDAIHYMDPKERRIREIQKKMSQAIGDTYAVLAMIDIQNNTGSQVFTNNRIVSLSDSIDIRKSLSEAINLYICDADKELIREFLDLDTISERCTGKRMLIQSCSGIYGKFYHTIVPLEYDEKGKVMKILAGIQIDENPEKFIRI